MSDNHQEKNIAKQDSEYLTRIKRFLERVMHPKNPEDYFLAVQYLFSPTRKVIDLIMLAQMQIEIIIDKLILHYFIEDNIVKQQQTEELIKATILACAQQSKRQDLLLTPKKTQYQKSIENLAPSELKKRWNTHLASITNLTREIASYKIFLQEIEKKEKVKVVEWREIAQAKREVYMQHLVDNNLAFKGLNGEEIKPQSETGQRIIDARAGVLSPTPIEVLSMANQSIRSAHNEGIAPPTEIRVAPQDARVALAIASVTHQIKALSEIAPSGTTGQGLYKANAVNRQALSLPTDRPQNQKVVIRKTPEMIYKKSLLKEGESNQAIDLDSYILARSAVKQKTSFVEQLKELGGGEVTGAELLKALRQQGATNKPGGQATSIIREKINPELQTEIIQQEQAILMGDTIALLQAKSKIEEKLDIAEIKRTYTLKLTEEDAKQYKKISEKVPDVDYSLSNLQKKI